MKISTVILIAVLFISSFIDTFSQGKPEKLDHWTPKQLLPSVVPGTGKAAVVKEDFSLTLRDGVKLDCSKFYIPIPNPYLPNGYPTVVMIHGYGDRKETLEHFAKDQASYNYVVYTYSMRGQGNSEGLSNLISMTEASDLIELINFIKQDFATGLDTSKVLLMGGSQGGIIPFMAACNGLKVNSIISSVASPEFASSWIENGSVKMTLLWTVTYTPDTARYAPQVEAMENWIYATGLKSNKWDSLAKYLPLNRDFKNDVYKCTVPILLENSWQDYFFNALGSINAIPNLNNDFSTYFGAVMGHGGDTSYSETLWHMEYFNNWFYKFLWKDMIGHVVMPRFNLAYSTFPRHDNMWSFIHDSSDVWPKANTGNLRLYFTQNSKLAYTPTTSTSYTSFINNVKKSNYTLQQAVYDEFKGTSFDAGFEKRSIYFESPVLTSKVTMLGVPKLNLKYFSNVNICQYNFQIYEVSAAGEKGLVTRINYTDRNYTASTTRTTSINGTAHGHIFQPGSKIRIELTNLDRYVSDSSFLGSNPFVLPVMKKGTNRIYYNTSYIDLPVILTGVTEGMNADNKSNIINGFNLEQNFPNPFNPVTKINFSLPEKFSGNVSLKIFDITGKEIAVLINSQLNGGNYNVDWNASQFSSGVYFYKLNAGDFSSVKKMVLVK